MRKIFIIIVIMLFSCSINAQDSYHNRLANTLAEQIYKKFSAGDSYGLKVRTTTFSTTAYKEINVHAFNVGWFEKSNRFSDYKYIELYVNMSTSKIDGTVNFTVYDHARDLNNRWTDQDIKNGIEAIKICKEIYDIIKK